MKKYLFIAALIALVMPVHRANAVVPLPAGCIAIPGACSLPFMASAPVTLTAVGTTLLPLALFTAGALNVDPWTPVFGKDHVFQEYPAGANHVFVEAQKVNYVVPSSHKPYHVMSRFGTDSIRSD